VSAGRSRAAPPEIYWSVVRDGLDFMESAVEHLNGGSERDLRYAALHLNAGIEILLKSRLAREHWTLVVDKVDDAKRTDYERGDFRSATITQAIERLRRVLDWSVTDEEVKRVKAVEKLRNRVAHFALHEDNPRATEATVARGLDVLLHFVVREIRPGSDKRAAHPIDVALKRLVDVVGQIEALARERMQRLRPDLEAAHLVVECPRCRQLAL
jgi:hypothetical protein